MARLASGSARRTPTTQNSFLKSLESIERKFESGLRDLRALRSEYSRDVTSKGILGSRGLTQFVIEQLQAESLNMTALGKGSPAAISILELIRRAERAGYEAPTTRTLSKRLTERQYRVGDIVYSPVAGGWYWQEAPEPDSDFGLGLGPDPDSVAKEYPE